MSMNYHFLGDNFTDIKWPGIPQAAHMHTDAMSANTQLGATHWEEFHTYRVEWRAGAS